MTWFKNYLKERIKIVDINSYLSLEKSFNIRVIQGSILGPILFLIYINDLCSVTDLLTLMFADKTANVNSDINIYKLLSHNNTVHILIQYLHFNTFDVFF